MIVKNNILRTHKGFTLLEILIALIILSIIGIITSAGLRSAIQAQHRMMNQASQLAKVQLAILILERDLEQTINRPILQAAQWVPAFLVEASSKHTKLVFTHAGLINPFASLNRSTLERVEYVWDEQTLVRRSWETLDQVKGEPTEQVLMTRVNVFEVKPFYKNPSQPSTYLNTPPPGEPLPTDKIPTEQDIQKLFPLPAAVEIHLHVEDLGDITRFIPLPTSYKLGIPTSDGE